MLIEADKRDRAWAVRTAYARPTDCAFRIGQRRNVLVHKFMTTGTVEERIDEMIAEKRKLADDILASDAEVNLTELSDEALMGPVRLDATRAAS